MPRNQTGEWNNLIIESSAHPPALPEDRFRDWMAGKRIFISSRMDSEMSPAREAVRDYLHSMGASPVMWEEITPRDERAQRAYLDGVDRSSIFLLMIGSSYGTADDSGYSPTHKEGNRAAEKKIPRLLFVLSGINDSDRDGRLNDWLRSLYNQLAGANYGTTNELVAQLDARLRETAAQSERIWIKLGNLVFPGKVSSRFEGNSGGQFTITARVQGSGIRRALLDLGRGAFARNNPGRLTWADKSYPVQVKSVSAETEFTAEDVIRIECRTPNNWYGDSGIGYNLSGLSAEKAVESWADRTIFGNAYNADSRQRGGDMTEAFTAPETITLPEVLSTKGASGWLAEGLSKLYLVEEFTLRYGGHFDSLEVSPATADSIRVNGEFSLGSNQNGKVLIQGSVSLREKF